MVKKLNVLSLLNVLILINLKSLLKLTYKVKRIADFVPNKLFHNMKNNVLLILSIIPIAAHNLHAIFVYNQ